MAKIYGSAVELVGNTPLVEVKNLEKARGLSARVLVKLEYLNPAGSVKDRVAKAMIEDAERSGKLKEGSVIIEPTVREYGDRARCHLRGERIPDHSDDAGDDERGAAQHPEGVRRGDRAD